MQKPCLKGSWSTSLSVMRQEQLSSFTPSGGAPKICKTSPGFCAEPSRAETLRASQQSDDRAAAAQVPGSHASCLVLVQRYHVWGGGDAP